MTEIVVEPLTEEAFAPFGQVIALGPLGRAHSTRYAADVANRRPEARLNVSISQQVPVPLPLQVKFMEKHPHSAQTFVPTAMERYLVLVCPADADGGPSLGELKAFAGNGSQGINYHPDTWHHPFTVLDAPGECVVLRHDMDDDEDTIWFEVADGLTVVDS
tara:strand:- start:841 stop:1323 length:483 start_codon:yes stop_codon:yes gene_type:complete